MTAVSGSCLHSPPVHVVRRLDKAPAGRVGALKLLILNGKCIEKETPNIVYQILVLGILFLKDNILNDVENL